MTSSRSELVDTQEVLRIVRMLPDVLFRCIKGANGKIYWTLNEGGLAEEFGLTTEKIQGVPLEELFPGGASEHIKEEFEAAFAGEERQWTNEIEGRYFRHFPKPVRNEQGEIESVIGFISDVTALVTTERELAQSFADLETFTSAVSHDLRTPLAALRNMISAVEHGNEEVRREAVGRMALTVERMQRMLDSLLNLSRVGQRGLHRQDVDATQVARNVAANMRARDPGRQVQIHIMPDMHFHADPDLLQTALENFLGNAWKHVPEGGNIWIRQSEADAVWLEVADDGDGFDPERAHELFLPFRQLNEQTEGLGIGLATVKRVAQAHDGQVDARATPGEGATFRIHFGGKA